MRIKAIVSGLMLIWWLMGGAVQATTVDLFDSSAPSTIVNPKAYGQLWYVSFTPTENMSLTGLGLIFDPTFTNVIPSIYLSVWKDQIVTNSDRLALLAPSMSVNSNDFSDLGMARYLFRFADDKAYGSPSVISLETGHIYFFLAQLNIDAFWPAYSNQHYSFVNSGGAVDVLAAGPYFNRSSQLAPPLFIEASEVPEPASIALLGLALGGLAASRRQQATAN